MENLISFSIVPVSEIKQILPLLSKLNKDAIPVSILKERLQEMIKQNYKCIGVYNANKLIGICGCWFQTRHYAGKSMEIDHVIIDNEYRNHGLGKKLMEFVYRFAKEKKCNWVELNTYVNNFSSHKFYYNEGFIAKGYHFIKPLD